MDKAETNLWSKIDKTQTCWLWNGATDKDGYALYRYGGAGTKLYRLHRYMYERFKSPIPGGFVVDHLCRVRNCLNPKHLEAITSRENIRRGSRKQQTHCIRGHEFDIKNTSIDKNGGRHCRKCYALHNGAKESLGYEISCKFCKKTIIKKRWGQVYCSNKCNDRFKSFVKHT